MSRACELRIISEVDAQSFLQYPEKLVQQEENRYERGKEAYKRTKDITSFQDTADPRSRFYDWSVLVVLVSYSHAAWQIFVQEGELVGGLDYPLGYEAKVLSASQVLLLSTALLNALEGMAESHMDMSDYRSQTPAETSFLDDDAYLPFVWEDEKSVGLEQEVATELTPWQMQQQLQRFIQEAADMNQALLILG